MCGITTKLVRANKNEHSTHTPSPYLTVSYVDSVDYRRQTYVDTNIQCLRDPVAGNTAFTRFQTIHIASCRASIVIDVASETRFVLWVTNKKHAFDCIERGAGQFRQSVDRSCCSLRVSFKDDASRWFGLYRGLYLVDDLWV